MNRVQAKPRTRQGRDYESLVAQNRRDVLRTSLKFLRKASQNRHCIAVWATLMVAAAVLLAACASGEITEPPATNSPAVEEESPTALTNSSEDGPSPEASEPGPNANTEEPPTELTVQTDRSVYRTDQEIIVNATNGLDRPITTIDQQGFCSIFRLEERTGAEWTELRNCYSGPPPQDVTIAAGETVTTTFPPQLEAGTYRVALVYTPGDHFIAGDNITVYSEPFQVR